MKILLLFTVLVFVWAQPNGPDPSYNEAGYINVGKGRELFYWFFESRNNPLTDPFVFWFSGGPGCSSQLALFGENGPYTVNKHIELELNKYSWTSNATVLWIDQPAGAGFSYGAVPEHNETQVADTMFTFMTKFFEAHDQYKHLDLWLFGESYAGHYVPAVAGKLVDEIKAGNSDLKFQGIGVGNGLTNPGEQFKHYPAFAEQYNLVSDPSLKLMKALLPLCETATLGCNEIPQTNATARMLKWEACIAAYTFCAMGELEPVTMNGWNPYDVREKCDPRYPLCYDFDDITTYLNQDDVMAALGVNKTWSDCNRLVDMEFVYGGDWMLRFDSQVTNVLESGRKVLVYVGEYDFICNWLGNEAWVLNLDWTGKTQFNQATNTTWTVDDLYAGSFKSNGGLTLLKVANAGHMVPRDQPVNALMMLNNMIHSKW